MAIDAFDINTPNAATVTVVHTIIDAQRLGNNKVAADDVELCSRHRRVAHAHGKLRRDGQLQLTGCLHHVAQIGFLRHSYSLVIGGFAVIVLQNVVNLWPCSMDDDDFHAQAMK